MPSHSPEERNAILARGTVHGDSLFEQMRSIAAAPCPVCLKEEKPHLSMCCSRRCEIQFRIAELERELEITQ